VSGSDFPPVAVAVAVVLGGSGTAVVVGVVDGSGAGVVCGVVVSGTVAVVLAGGGLVAVCRVVVWLWVVLEPNGSEYWVPPAPPPPAASVTAGVASIIAPSITSNVVRYRASRIGVSMASARRDAAAASAAA
jgi:hypothetical protein